MNVCLWNKSWYKNSFADLQAFQQFEINRKSTFDNDVYFFIISVNSEYLLFSFEQWLYAFRKENNYVAVRYFTYSFSKARFTCIRTDQMN